MPKKPRENDLLSLTQLAAKLRINRGTLSRKLSALKSVAGPKGARLYPLAEVSALLDEERSPELLEARRRKLVAEAGLAELRLRKERGELADYREVVADFMGVFRHFHTWLTVSMPERLSGRVYRAESAARAAELLREEAERMLAEFREERLRHLAGAEAFTQEVEDDQA